MRISDWSSDGCSSDLSCGQLLERPEVTRWVHSVFPMRAVDEAQELAPPRLRIVRALADKLDAFVAADEFQWLDEGLDTGPFVDWFNAGNVQQQIGTASCRERVGQYL